MYQQYFDDFFKKTQYRLLELGTEMALKYARGEQIFLEEIAECRDLRRARRVLTSIYLTDRQKYDFTIRVIDYYRLDRGLSIDLDQLCITTGDFGGVGSGGTGGPVIHNATLEKDAGDPVNNYYGHLTKDEIDWIKQQRFVGPVISFPNANFGSVVNPIPGNLSRTLPNDGAEKGTTFAYGVDVTISPNSGIIQSIKVFKSTGGVENPIPIIETLGLSFTINDSLTVNTSYRLEVKYANTTGSVVTSNTIRAVNFYYPTYIGVGDAAMTEVAIKALEKHIWSPSNRSQIGFQVNVNYMHFVEPYFLTRRIIDVAIDYTTSWLHTNPNYTFGSDIVAVDSMQFVNALVQGVYVFDFFID